VASISSKYSGLPSAATKRAVIGLQVVLMMDTAIKKQKSVIFERHGKFSAIALVNRCVLINSV